jgi:hydroxymethylpyrimidine/phosphomethylpyrimidine kinase
MAQQLRERIHKWGYIKLKSFCTTKQMVTRLKKQPTEWKKIFASYISDKELIPRVYKELKKLNSPKINDPVMIWENKRNKAFSMQEVQIAKKTPKQQQQQQQKNRKTT